MHSDRNDITQLLERAVAGSSDAWERLMPMIYDELRNLASAAMLREQAGHTLEPTALVHEAFLKLVRQNQRTWQNRAHFFATAAETMRRVLVDHARIRNAAKRQGDRSPEPLDRLLVSFESCSTDLLALDDALQQLRDFDERQCQIVELRFFGGLTNEQIAQLLGISESTVERDWRVARAWLLRAIEGR